MVKRNTIHGFYARQNKIRIVESQDAHMQIARARIVILNARFSRHLHFYESMFPIRPHHIQPMTTAIRWKKIGDEDVVQLPRSVR